MRPSGSISLALSLVWLSAAATTISAQQRSRVQLPAEPSCRECTIELTTVARLGQPGDSVLLGALSGAVAMTSRGQFIALAGSGVQVAVYDASGRFLLSFGKRGGGPGEFQTLTDVRVGPGDSVIVADGRNNVQVFGPTFEYARTIRIPDPGSLSQALFLPSGAIIKQTSASRLWVMDLNGTVRDSIPVVPVPGSRTCARCNKRWLAPARAPGRFWSSVSNRYQIELLDRTGTAHQILTRRTLWFVPWDSVPRVTRERSAPEPTLGPLREDSDGLLWCLARVADPKWKEVDTRGPASVAMFNGLDDGMISVIDPRAGVVLAERRLAGSVGFVGQTDLVFSQEEDSDGYVTLHIQRVQLKRR